MKKIYIGIMMLGLVCAVSSSAYCRDSLASTEVSLNYTLVDGSIGGGSFSQSTGGDNSDPLLSAFALDDGIVLTQGGAQLTYGGSAFSGASKGMLGVSASVIGTASFPSAGLTPGGAGVEADGLVRAEADINDTITFTSRNPKLQGQAFQMNSHFILHGTLSSFVQAGTPTSNTTFNSNASSDGSLTVFGTGLPSDDLADDGKSVDYAGNNFHFITAPPSQVPVILTGFWGVPMNVDYHLILTASAYAFTNDIINQGGAGASADGEFSHTLAWGGIDSVVDGDGNPVTDAFDATSESGFDWSQPAVEPEPSSIALCGFGAISTIAAYRRRDPRTQFRLARLRLGPGLIFAAAHDNSAGRRCDR